MQDLEPISPGKRKKGEREPYDPERHCGAAIKGKHLQGTNRPPGSPCIFPKGHRTPHPGVGKCWLHGGATPIRAGGKRSQVYTSNLQEEIDKLLADPELLSLDEQIAYLKLCYKESMVAHHLRGKIGDDENPPAEMEKLDTLLQLTTALNGLVRTSYDMRFAKRFSVPVSELRSILEQIGLAFQEICREFGVPQEAVATFAKRLSELRVSRPIDLQLERAGDPGTRQTIAIGPQKPFYKKSKNEG